MSSLALYSSQSFSLTPSIPQIGGNVSSFMGMSQVFEGVSHSDITADPAGNLYVTDRSGFGGGGAGSAIWKILPGGSYSVFAGSLTATGDVDATGTSARFFIPEGITLLTNGNLATYDYQNNKIKEITLGGVVTSWAFNTVVGQDTGLGVVAAAPAGEAYLTGGLRIGIINSSSVGSIIAGPAGFAQAHLDGTGIAVRFTFINDITIDPTTGDIILVENSHYVRRCTPAGVVTTIAGNGTNVSSDGAALSAGIPFPNGVAVGPDGTIYISSFGDHTIKKLSGGNVTTIAGQAGSSGWVDGSGSTARFLQPGRMVYNNFDNGLYVLDQGHTIVRKVL